MRERLSDVLTDFAESTTAHAPPKIVTHKHILSKLFWGLLFITGLGVFVYFSQELILTYLKFETTTDIQLKFSVLEFPAVTICNQNQFRKDRAMKELHVLLDDFMQSKRADMFGGKDKFQDFKQQALLRLQQQQSGSSSNGDPEGGPAGDPEGNVAGNADDNSAGDGDNENVTPAVEKEGEGAGEEGQNTPPLESESTTAQVQAPAPNSPPNSTNGESESTTAQVQEPAPNSPPNSPSGDSGKRRRKRSVEYTLTEKEMEVLHDMEGFYHEPELELFENMSWFANSGQTSSEKSILLNLTQYIAQYPERDLIEAGHDIQEMLQECVFMGTTCGPEDFYHFYDNKYGNCYTFNSGMDGQVARITNPGASFGLSLSMYVNQGQYIPVLTQEAGMRVLLHKQGQVPIMEEDGFDVTPGTKSGIAVRYVEVSRLDGVYSNCTTESNRTLNGKHDYYPGNYTQKACLKTCLQKGIIESCGCANPLYRRPMNESVCGPEDNACVADVELNLLDNDVCSAKCPTPCWESQYQYVISSSQWPSNNYMPFLKESLDERGDEMKDVMKSDTRTGLSENFLKLVVYYDNLNYYKYVERPSMTLKDLIGALGGHLGLWIGMSIVSFVEVFELILCMIKWCTRNVRTNKTSSLTDLGEEEHERGCQTPVLSIKDSWVKEPSN